MYVEFVICVFSNGIACSTCSHTNLGNDNMETMPMMDGEDLGGQPSPAEPVGGSVWEEDNKRSLEEAEVEAAEAKREYFKHEDVKQTVKTSDVAKSGEAPEQEIKEEVTTTEEKHDESKSESVEEMPVLGVDNEKWMKKHVPKDQEKATAKVEVKEIPKALPSKPDCWNKAPCISPAEQCPPKPRGRKPKQKQEEQKGSRSNKKRSHSPSKKDERTKKRSKTTPAPEAEAAEVEVPEPKRKRKEKAEPESTKPDPPSKRLRKYLQEAKDPKEARRAKEKEQETKKSKKGKQVMTEEEEKEKKKKEQKAKVSRKSSAYHKAYAATEGTEEEKRSAAKKVLLAQITCIRFDNRLMYAGVVFDHKRILPFLATHLLNLRHML